MLNASSIVAAMKVPPTTGAPMNVLLTEVAPENVTPEGEPWLPAAVPSTAPNVRPVGMFLV